MTDMPKWKSILGLRFGRLLVVEELRLPGAKHRSVVVECDCGVRKEVGAEQLMNGNTKSCGCLRREATAARKRKHGKSKGSAEYRAWKAMNARCSNPATDRFQRYGGRGIRVCDSWKESFEAFFACVGARPSPDHSIDRIDVNGHYEPGNVRWATRAQQAANRSVSIRHEVELRILALYKAGLTVRRIAMEAGVSLSTVMRTARGAGLHRQQQTRANSPT